MLRLRTSDSLNGDPTVWDYINGLIRQGQYLLAVLCILIMQGYADDITAITFNEDGTGVIYLNINDTQVVIHVGGTSGVDYGMTQIPEKEGDPVHVYIYTPAFFNNGDPCAQKIWHVVGHEMVHAKHMVKGGVFWYWVALFMGNGLDITAAKQKAAFLSDVYAYQWNIEHFNDAPYEGGLCFFLKKWNEYLCIYQTGHSCYNDPLVCP